MALDGREKTSERQAIPQASGEKKNEPHNTFTRMLTANARSKVKICVPPQPNRIVEIQQHRRPGRVMSYPSTNGSRICFSDFDSREKRH
ncbi:MAG: hypothetical protein CL920_07950 [Deltaproteobacteria bacterium]|nr:hypothetical protein [Deltaproteobacteria bacterium]MBU48612.1 hypothetical protein [Deltaproteobacteria bacterium]